MNLIEIAVPTKQVNKNILCSVLNNVNEILLLLLSLRHGLLMAKYMSRGKKARCRYALIQNSTFRCHNFTETAVQNLSPFYLILFIFCSLILHVYLCNVFDCFY